MKFFLSSQFVNSARFWHTPFNIQYCNKYLISRVFYFVFYFQSTVQPQKTVSLHGGDESNNDVGKENRLWKSLWPRKLSWYKSKIKLKRITQI